MQDNPELLDFRLKAIEKQQDEDAARMKTIESAIESLKEERSKALRWGVTTLGTILIGLVSWIANLLVGGHLK